MIVQDLPRVHAQLVAGRPLVQNITNTVVQQFSANVLLAIGASPAMLDHPADAGEFAGTADALLVNFGTASDQQLLASDAAIAVAETYGKPWVLDPVSMGVVRYRSGRIRQASAHHPTVIRGNASEIAALAGVGHGGHGVDSTMDVDAVLPAAIRLAQATGSIIAVSGIRDAVLSVTGDTVEIARVGGGSALMPRVVGTGCALGSAVAAYLAAGRQDPEEHLDFVATVAAHAHFKLAGAAAGQRTQSPGSFGVAFIDALYELNSDQLAGADVASTTRTLSDFAGAST